MHYYTVKLFVKKALSLYPDAPPDERIRYFHSEKPKSKSDFKNWFEAEHKTLNVVASEITEMTEDDYSKVGKYDKIELK